MNKNALLRIVSVFVFLANLVVVFLLFAKIRNITLTNTIHIEQNGLYALLALVLICSMILLILSLTHSKTQNSEEKYKRQTVFEMDNEKTQEDSNTDKTHYEKLDIDYFTNKIIPKQTTKLDLTKYTEKILSNIAKEFDIVQGLFFVKAKDSDTFSIAGKYAYFGDEEPKSFNLGETLSGQVAKNKKVLNLKEIPENYITILSGLGSSSPNHLIIIPVLVQDQTVAIIELASFKEFKRNFKELFEAISEKMGNELVKY